MRNDKHGTWSFLRAGRAAAAFLLLGPAVQGALFAATEEAAAAPARERALDETSIRELRESLVAAGDIESTSERRLALKRIVRGASSLLEQNAGAPKRFQVLGLVFRAQKELLVLKNDTPNQRALLDTARKLVEAPGEYAAERLEAEFLLMQMDLQAKGATEHEQA